jgi:SAM-dependent methyltransferase
VRTEARERWRDSLEAWSIPQHLLDAVADSPYEWPVDLYERATRAAGSSNASWPTLDRITGLAGPGGSVLDVGAGSGRVAIPLARHRHRVTVVERNEEMIQALARASEDAGVEITRIVGSWPQVAGNAGRHDVVTSSHVVYDVAAIGPFVEAMHRAARRGVVVEMTERHPWSGLSRYFELLHGLKRPTGPTADDFCEVVAETVGATPEVERWRGAGGLRFADLPELLAFYRRRLLVPPERSVEASALLEHDVERTDDGWLVLGAAERPLVTVWWRV